MVLPLIEIKQGNVGSSTGRPDVESIRKKPEVGDGWEAKQIGAAGRSAEKQLEVVGGVRGPLRGVLVGLCKRAIAAPRNPE
jgi:hypothetical protein